MIHEMLNDPKNGVASVVQEPPIPGAEIIDKNFYEMPNVKVLADKAIEVAKKAADHVFVFGLLVASVAFEPKADGSDSIATKADERLSLAFRQLRHFGSKKVDENDPNNEGDEN